jgi:hypothetical protein
MAKMCKYYDELCWASKRKCLTIKECPKNTNSRCEIISKTKPNMVKVKAWAWKSKGVYGWCATELKGPKRLNCYPCYILIERKYLKGDK